VSGHPGIPQIKSRAPRDVAWQTQAACTNTDPEAFFPTAGRYVTVGARRVCTHCPVQAACLEYALTHSEWYGIWGGLSVDERRELYRRRKSTRKRVGA
jgi:WhiB family redox-sensing transcriptional regulator